MALTLQAPARSPLFRWLARLAAGTRKPAGKPHLTPAHMRRAELARNLALAQMPEHLRRDLDIDGGARMAQPERRSGWPIW